MRHNDSCVQATVRVTVGGSSMLAVDCTCGFSEFQGEDPRAIERMLEDIVARTEGFWQADPSPADDDEPF